MWTIWLIPYFCGMLMDIPAIGLSRTQPSARHSARQERSAWPSACEGMSGGQHIGIIEVFEFFFVVTQSA